MSLALSAYLTLRMFDQRLSFGLRLHLFCLVCGARGAGCESRDVGRGAGRRVRVSNVAFREVESRFNRGEHST